MTFTKETDCSAITITDTQLTTFYDADTPSTTTVVVQVTYNCATTYTELTIEQEADMEYVDDIAYFVITPELLGQSGDVLNDGIYTIKLVVDYDAGDHYDDTVCVAILCGIQCDILEYQANNLTSNIYPFYQVLD